MLPRICRRLGPRISSHPTLPPGPGPGGPTRAVVRLAHCGHTAYRRCGLSPGTVLVRNNYSQFGFGGAYAKGGGYRLSPTALPTVLYLTYGYLRYLRYG